MRKTTPIALPTPAKTDQEFVYVVAADLTPDGPREYFAGNDRWVSESKDARTYDDPRKASIVAENLQQRTSHMIVFVKL